MEQTVSLNLEEALAQVTTFFPQSVIDVCKKIVCEEYKILLSEIQNTTGYHSDAITTEARYIAIAILVDILPSVSRLRIQSDFFSNNKSVDATNYGLNYVRERCRDTRYNRKYEKLREKVWSASPFAPDWSFADDVRRKRDYVEQSKDKK